MSSRPRKLLLIGFCTVLAAALTLASAAASPEESDLSGGESGIPAHNATSWTTVDHSRHEALQKDFDSGPEVTEACLSCHNQAAEQVQETIHWTWLCPADPQGVMGKRGLTINNF